MISYEEFQNAYLQMCSRFSIEYKPNTIEELEWPLFLKAPELYSFLFGNNPEHWANMK